MVDIAIKILGSGWETEYSEDGFHYDHVEIDPEGSRNTFKVGKFHLYVQHEDSYTGQGDAHISLAEIDPVTGERILLYKRELERYPEEVVDRLEVEYVQLENQLKKHQQEVLSDKRKEIINAQVP